MNKKETVFVGVSGGVDSSVSLAILKEEGYNVVGCFIKTWQPDFIECTWKEERRDAMRICAKLDVPFLTIDAEEEYKNSVGMYMINEYRAGRTPNPDVMCNKEVKFGVFLKKAIELGADFVATGHYARTENGKLLKGKDDSKDQSYFLWTLTAEQLLKTKFPIGHLQKSEVRKIAEKYELFTAEKKDSQGVCFLGPIDMKDFLKHYIEVSKGDVLDTAGNVIGHHDGALFYTLGERHGLTITEKGTEDKRLYVIERDLEKNTLTVSENINQQKEEKKKIKLENINWITKPEEEKTYGARIRYGQKLEKCQVDGNSIIFENEQSMATAGQSVVIYDGEECMGGGVIA
ncbi:MAG: tRNA-uridine 2-sulfurtransferase [Patescibacteria group bacterium]|nr:tRNA-uridine 2-sulfurtransferase [Patescibacteria group bacterium]